MRVNLMLDNDKVRKVNERYQELEKEDKMYENLQIYSLEDRFVPYTKAFDGVNNFFEADYRSDFDGVYCCEPNMEGVIEMITNYKQVTDFRSPIYWESIGVCDNASQVLDHFDNLYEKYKDYMNGKKFIILLTPVYKEDGDGWRWDKFGQYIGKFNARREYLSDEKGIDFVLCFDIIQVEECQ